MRPSIRHVLISVFAIAALFAGRTRLAAEDDKPRMHQLIAVPEEDRFLPFALVIHAGDTVEWVNNDSDDHTVVSDDALNTTGPKNVNVVIPGTGEAVRPATEPFHIRFEHRGVFVFYCRFHAHLDEQNQPVAPGTDGGIQGVTTLCDPSGAETCNFGTPMMGVITVLPRRHAGEDESRD
jgi:plastocyanin